MPQLENDEMRSAMESQKRGTTSPFSSTGEPRSGDVAITVLTALILFVVLIAVAVL